MSIHSGTHGSHPWQSAKDEWELKILPRLKRHGKAIGSAAYDGDQNAMRVLEAYHLLLASFDPMTLELLKQALRIYEEHNAAASERRSTASDGSEEAR